MQIFFDLAAGYFVAALGSKDRLTALSFKRGDNVTVGVVFCSGIQKLQLASGATGVLGLKTTGDYDGNFLASSSSWTLDTSDPETPVYKFALNLNTTALNDALGVGPAPDVASIVTMMEMEFVVGGITTSSNTIAATIDNDVVRGSETGPIVITPGTPVNAVAGTKAQMGIPITSGVPANNSTWTVGGRIYTFKDTAAATGQITRGTTQAEAGTNMVAAINGDSFNTAHADVSAIYSNLINPAVTIVARLEGVAGNAIGVSASSYAIPSPGHLTGGVDPIPATSGFQGSMMTAPGWLYVASSMSGGQPVWQKVALSAL